MLVSNPFLTIDTVFEKILKKSFILIFRPKYYVSYVCFLKMRLFVFSNNMHDLDPNKDALNSTGTKIILFLLHPCVLKKYVKAVKAI